MACSSPWRDAMRGVSEPIPARPRQVTMAGWLIMVGSAFALGLVVQRLSGLHTLESQETINNFLAKPPGSDLGISTDTVITTIRTLSMVDGGLRHRRRHPGLPGAAPQPERPTGGHGPRRAALPRRHGHRRLHHLGGRRVGRDPVAPARAIVVRRQARAGASYGAGRSHLRPSQRCRGHRAARAGQRPAPGRALGVRAHLDLHRAGRPSASPPAPSPWPSRPT